MKLVLTFTLALALALGTFSWFWFSSESSKAHVVAILQTTSNPDLDAVRQSFKEQLQKDFNENIQFIEENGLGKLDALQMMAQSFHEQKKIELILAIGTPAIQAIADIEKEKPLVFAAVTDPSVLELDLEKTHIYGVRTHIEAKDQVQAIVNSFSNINCVGLLYNPSETTSQSAALNLSTAMQEKGIEVESITVQSAADISQNLDSVCHKCDLILCPTDHLVKTSMPLITNITNTAKRPLVVSDLTLCGPNLATAAYGINYKEVGRLSSEIAFSLIQKNKPKEHVLQATPDWLLNTENYNKIFNPNTQ